MTTLIDVIFGDIPLWNINRYTSEFMFLSFRAKLSIAHCLLQFKQKVYCSSFVIYLKKGGGGNHPVSRYGLRTIVFFCKNLNQCKAIKVFTCSVYHQNLPKDVFQNESNYRDGDILMN